MEKKLVVIDGNSLLYRAFYALPPLTAPDGTPTNGVYGFLRMLLGLYRDLDPAYLAVSFDKDKHTFRMEKYADYKGTRKPAPPDLVPQFALIRDVLRAMGAAVYEISGYEGDDILGTLAAEYEKDMPVALITGDRDALQLASGRTTVYLTQKGISTMAAMTPEAVEEKYGITPAQVVDMKALMGDASDNIPGVAGIGEKTAVKLLKEFGTLSAIYDRIDEVKGAKLKEKLAKGKDDAFLSQDLARIRTDVPLSMSLSDMERPVHGEEMKSLFQRLGFGKLAEEFAALPRFQMLAASQKKVEEQKAPDLVPWTEGDTFEGKVVALSVVLEGTAPFYTAEDAVAAGEGWAFHIDKGHLKEAAEALKKAKAVVTDKSKALWETGIFAGLPYFDVTLGAYLLDQNRTDYPLSYLAELLSVSQPFGDTLDDPLQKKGAEAAFLFSLYEPMKKKLEEAHVEELYDKVEQPLVEVLSSMERAGIATDEERWKEVRADMAARRDALLSEIYEAAGETFNINSPRQLGHILFEKIGMPAGKKTKTGYSTAAGVLEELAETYPVVKSILEYRTLAKLISTYLDALPQLIRPDTGRIHTSFNQTVTATGRLSSSDPNLQNIPVRTAEGKKIRSLFVPGKGYDAFISSDYSQIELRVLAHMSGDESLIGAFLRHEDIHRRTAAEVLGISLEEVTPEERSHAKAVNFGIIYGISDFGLARQLGITRKAAADYIERYFARYPRIHEFMESLVEKARETGRAETLFGRFRALPDIRSTNFNRRSFAERTAMNTPIQGTAADIMKIAMIDVYRKLKEGRFQSRILLQVHDELVVEAVKEEESAVAALLKTTMEGAALLKAPLQADVHIGKDWAETK